MLQKLPPLPVGVVPGSGYWNDWYEKLRLLVNGFSTGFPWASIADTPTTLSGYGITQVDVTNDVIIDSSGAGVVLKSPNGHYWRGTISNLGVVTYTDLGTTKP